MKKLFVLCLMLVVGSGYQAIAQNNKEGRKVKEIALSLEPGPNNPRNSEGDFITLKDGRILFVYSHYTGASANDRATPAYLAGEDIQVTVENHGQPKMRKIVEQEGTMNVMSVSLLRLKNGEIALFYLKKNSTTDCIPMARFSKDEAQTWSSPLPCITDKAGYFVLNNNRVIQLKSGRILMAVNLYAVPKGSLDEEFMELLFR